LVNCTFRECDLSLVEVPGSQFATVRLEGSKAIGVDWTRADWTTGKLAHPLAFARCALNHSTFIGLDLPSLELIDCVAVDVDFREAVLTGANLAGTDLTDSLFVHTNLSGADLSRARNYRIDPGQNTVQGAKFSLPEAISLLYALDIILVDEPD
jgi:uncharacterized protein YjbI with pentapeptide repeats